MSALTDLGFNRPTYDEILEAQENRAKELFGEQIDTSELTILGKYIRLNVADLDELYQTLEGVYYSRFPSTASGVSLDRLCVFAGIERNAPTAAEYQITLKGTPGETIEFGFEVSNATQSLIFSTIDDYVIPENGLATVIVRCDTAGPEGNIYVKTIDTIVNAVEYVDSIIIDLAKGDGLISSGLATETDTELRKRFIQAIAGSGLTTLENIRSAVLRVDGVSDCIIIENDSEEVKDGLPPHSFKCYVLGATANDDEVAKAIFDKKPIGIHTCGDITTIIADDYGNEHEVSFSHTSQKNVYIAIELETNNFLEDSAEATIKANLISYINSLSAGESLYLSKLYSLINITGVKNIKSLGLGTNFENTGVRDITCEPYEVARTNEDSIKIILDT